MKFLVRGRSDGADTVEELEPAGKRTRALLFDGILIILIGTVGAIGDQPDRVTIRIVRTTPALLTSPLPQH